MRPELKPLLDYLARLTFEDLMREASQPAPDPAPANDSQAVPATDLPTRRSAA